MKHKEQCYFKQTSAFMRQTLKLKTKKGKGLENWSKYEATKFDTFFGNLTPCGGRVMCSCASGSLYIAHLSNKGQIR